MTATRDHQSHPPTSAASPGTGAALALPGPSPGAAHSGVGAGVPGAGVGALSSRTAESVAAALGLRVLADLNGVPASAEFVEKIPIGFARQHGLIGLAFPGSGAGHPGAGAARLPVALADLASWEQLEVVSRFLNRPVEAVVAPAGAIAAAINAAYQQRSGQAQALIGKLDRRDVLAELEAMPAAGAGGGGREDLLDVSGRAPVIKLVNLILFEAVQQLASDVHVQPYEDRLVVRMRIDGVLFDAFDIPKGLQEEVLSRVKIMGRMNIAEKRLAQDGRATVQVGDRLIDLRIASLPTSAGERIVIRLLDKSARLYTLNDLGMPSAGTSGRPSLLDQFRQLIGIEHGLILVTGPTGSGKSTTLYAALQELNAQELNILTLEDPIEYQLPGVSQTQVSDKKGMTFASGLRHVLRQDPDIIMVGEIRDHETAVMAIQSSLTGHLVFSTLHTNDAASAVTRLLDLGIEPYLVASSLVGVLAQRLVRRVCAACAAPPPPERPPSPEDLRRLGLGSAEPGTPGRTDLLTSAGLRQGRGCPQCRATGYKGRVGLFELMVIDDAIRRKVQVAAPAAEIKEAAVAGGMRTLREGGVEKILSGVTTIEEVLRVTMRATH